MRTQSQKGLAFRALHARSHAFIIPNPWDVGTARMLAQIGFEALASTSAGHAFSVGRRDNTLDRGETMSHLAAIASAVDLPVSADLGNGFGDAPEVVAKTIKLAAETGIVGGSIEDSTGNPEDPIYEMSLAVERVRAAAEAASRLPFVFTLTARAENYLHGKPDLGDTIARLQAFQQAGADVLYAPGLISKEDISAVVRALDRPVNVLAGLPGLRLSLDELTAIGVKRVSVGSGLARAAIGAVLRAGREMQEHGTFTFSEHAVPSINAVLKS